VSSKLDERKGREQEDLIKSPLVASLERTARQIVRMDLLLGGESTGKNARNLTEEAVESETGTKVRHSR